MTLRRHCLNLGAIALLAFLLLQLFSAAADASTSPDATEAHKYADGVLLQRFTAAVNDWRYQHPQDRPGKDWEHCGNLDAGDVRRFQTVREAFRELDQAMKRAGY